MYKKAFTLAEISLGIVLISILFVISAVMINPNKQLGNINNASRRSDVFAIYNAINQYRNANLGKLPDGITSTARNICQAVCTPSSTQIDISTELNQYLRSNTLPIDPLQTGTTLTGYTVYVTPEGRVVVAAPLAQNGVTINTLE